MSNHQNRHRSVMSRDYKSSQANSAINTFNNGHNLRNGKVHWMGLAASIAILGSIFFLSTDNAKATRNEALVLAPNTALDISSETITAPATRITLPLAIPQGSAGNGTGTREKPTFSQPKNSAKQTQPKLPENNIDWRTATVKSGDSLALIFARQGLSPQQLDRVMRADKSTAALKRLMPGQQFTFHIDNDQLQHLVYKIDALNTLNIRRNAQNEYVVATDTREMESRITNTTGVIDSSLFLAGMAAGMSDNLIMELAGIFGWDIDFVLDIRSGDHFTLVYEELYLDGHKQRDGNILAAEFVNRGKVYRAVRYVDAKNRADYYSPDGRSMRKAFIRTPVDFTRISSRFGKRYHPTLKKRKNHHGVDYAAPRGTPIKAAGDGKLTYVGRKGGYGKTVIIQHGGKYSTLYAHMSRIKPGSRRGKRVRQGETIGYVGSTGRSTGPHLHYEFRVNGVHRNPLTVRLPDAAPIKAQYKADFLNKAQSLVAQLDVLQRTNVALNDRGE
ncbi:MAG: peptidoglycan DD-metalloendopeptidase family protein [Ectothiorhodospiraceae bacterium]|nr:peptidoglycan DD-metalloendopeptidase family protein [Ectothiorhodospiraceae bacterium]